MIDSRYFLNYDHNITAKPQPFKSRSNRIICRECCKNRWFDLVLVAGFVVVIYVNGARSIHERELININVNNVLQMLDGQSFKPQTSDNFLATFPSLV